MALYDKRLDPLPATRRRDAASDPLSLGSALPLILAVALAALLIAAFYLGDGSRITDTNNVGPSVKTVTPEPSPSTSPVTPTPIPTGEPRPTQAPIR